MRDEGGGTWRQKPARHGESRKGRYTEWKVKSLKAKHRRETGEVIRVSKKGA